LVTFATPGLTYKGTASVSAKSTATMGSSGLTCKTGTKAPKAGTLLASKIVSSSTTLCQNDTTPPTPCPTGEYVYDSAVEFADLQLYQAEKTTSWKVGSTTYRTKNTGSPTVGAGSGPGNCPPGEVGLVLTGQLTAPASQIGKSTEITACFLADSGPGTSGSFANDIVAEVAGNTGITIQTATLDAANSTVEFA
jgi:hypothetical protein